MESNTSEVKGKGTGIKIVAAIAIVALVAVAAVFALSGGNNAPSDVHIATMGDEDVKVIDPFQPQLSPYQFVSPESYGDVDIGEFESIMDRVVDDNGYRSEIDLLIDDTNSRLLPIIAKLNDVIKRIAAFSETVNVNELEVTGYSSPLGAFGFCIRADEDHFITFMVKSLNEVKTFESVESPKVVSEFRAHFPNISDLYDKNGIELNATNIFLVPDEIQITREARMADYDLTKWSHAEFINQDRFGDISSCDVMSIEFYEYLDGCSEQLTESQLAEFNTLMDEFNTLNDEYGAILYGFATSLIDLQVEWYLKLR